MEDTAIPSDANGVYSLPNGYLAVTGETIQASQHNPPLEDLASAMSARLMRSGVAPMTGPHKIVDGSPGSPAVQFNSASGTGFYKTANGIGVAVGGTKVAEFTAGGISRFLGELISYSGLTAQPLTVFPFGQTLSRTAYPDFWAFAQTEIAGGNTFYNNGDGSTTFGVGDCRGKVIAGKDDMGGTAAGNLTTPDGTKLGASGGTQAVTLDVTQIPAHPHTGTALSAGDHDHGISTVTTPGGGTTAPQRLAGTNASTLTGVTTTAGAHVHTLSIDNAGGGLSHSNVQPTMVCTYLLFAGA